MLNAWCFKKIIPHRNCGTTKAVSKMFRIYLFCMKYTGKTLLLLEDLDLKKKTTKFEKLINDILIRYCFCFRKEKMGEGGTVEILKKDYLKQTCEYINIFWYAPFFAPNFLATVQIMKNVLITFIVQIEGFITTPTTVGQQQCESNSGFDAIDLPLSIDIQFAYVCKYVEHSEGVFSLYRIPLLVCHISALTHISFSLLSYVE